MNEEPEREPTLQEAIGDVAESLSMLRLEVQAHEFVISSLLSAVASEPKLRQVLQDLLKRRGEGVTNSDLYSTRTDEDLAFRQSVVRRMLPSDLLTTPEGG